MDSGSAAITFATEFQTKARNRLTTAFRPILSIPHLLLVDSFTNLVSGVLGALAGVCALLSWFAILFTGKHPRGLWDLGAMFVRWHARASAYMALLRDEYPPFGDGAYPFNVSVEYPEGARDRLSVGLRLLYVLPHIVVLLALLVVWLATTVIAWFAILFTGRYPEGLYGFGVGVLRWLVRVEAYALLLRDEYPPFSLGE